MFISSDEIDVSSEEDVFKIILAWVEGEKRERTKYFAELFSEVRLVYVSRDYLHSDIMTNDLVNANEGCMVLVKEAIKLINSESYSHLTVKPRKSLEIPVLLICTSYEPNQIVCYNTREDKWFRLRGTIPQYTDYVISCRGKLYITYSDPYSGDRKLLCYDSSCNCWTSLPFDEKWGRYQLFARNEDEIYALVYAVESPANHFLCSRGVSSGKKRFSFITKYKAESNSWEDIISFDLGSRVGVCAVANDNFIYLIGGYAENQQVTLKDTDRYDLSTNKWGKRADLLGQRSFAGGASAYRKVFIVGGLSEGSPKRCGMFKHVCTALETCKVYCERTNEWQLIASPMIKRGPAFENTIVVCVDGNY